MGSFVRDLVTWVINAFIFCLVLNAILSWLIAFDVVNMRNRFIYQLTRFLDALTRPVLRPIQRIIPPFGGVDITPVLVIVVLALLVADVIPIVFAPLVAVLG